MEMLVMLGQAAENRPSPNDWWATLSSSLECSRVPARMPICKTLVNKGGCKWQTGPLMVALVRQNP